MRIGGNRYFLDASSRALNVVVALLLAKTALYVSSTQLETERLVIALSLNGSVLMLLMTLMGKIADVHYQRKPPVPYIPIFFVFDLLGTALTLFVAIECIGRGLDEADETGFGMHMKVGLWLVSFVGVLFMARSITVIAIVDQHEREPGCFKTIGYCCLVIALFAIMALSPRSWIWLLAPMTLVAFFFYFLCYFAIHARLRV